MGSWSTDTHLPLRFPYLALVLAIALSGSATRAAEPPVAASFAEAIEDAHGLAAWQSKPAVKVDLSFEYDGQDRLDGTLLFETSGSRMSLYLVGMQLGFDGQAAWVAPPESDFEKVRFHTRALPFFLAAPLRLGDPDSRFEDLGGAQLAGRAVPAARWTFSPSTTDPPGPWFVLYRDPGTDLLEAMVYAEIYGMTAEGDDESGPRAVTYSEFESVEGVDLATRWEFWRWNAEEGLVGEPIGRMDLGSIEFVVPAEDEFDPPEGARRIDSP